MVQPQPQFQLVELQPEEAKELTTKLDAIMAEYGAAFSVAPIITEQGTIGAKLHIFKRVELVPKSDGVPFPKEFLVNGETPEEPKSEGAAA